ncbi:MAG TPA: sensor histidine kinase [Chitinophagaceae bacterium]|nr:sensor histidine kinase [Chitinophagaceae bacterium]
MKLLLILLILAIAIPHGNAQNNAKIIDSLERLAAVQKDSALAKTYNELTWQYRLVDRDKAIEYGNKAIALAKKINFPSSIAQAYNDLGILYYDKEDYDTAIQLYQRAMPIRLQLNDELGVAKLYNKIGIVYQKEGQFQNAEDAQQKALAIFKKYNNDFGVSYSLNNIGILNQNMGRYDEAIQYQEESIALKEKLGDKIGLAGSYVNVGNIYLLKKKYDKTKEYYQKGVAISRQLGDKEYLSNALNNLGNLYVQTKEYNQAIAVVNESFSIRESLGDTKGMVSCLNNKASVFLAQKKNDSAETVLKLALQKGFNAVNCKLEVSQAYLEFSQLYEQENKASLALDMYKLYANTRDSIYTDGLSKNFAAQEVKYKTLEKEKQIVEQQFQITRRNYFIWAISGILILGGMLGYSAYRRYRLKQQAKLQAEIVKQQDIATKAVISAEENERKRIAAELHDGVGQMMSAAKMNLSSIEDEISFSSAEQKERFDRVVALIDDSCGEVRTVSHNMMPNALLKSGLALAVREFIDKIDEKVIHISLHAEGLNEKIDSNIETVLYRVIQECVNNVIKHARAGRLDISLVKDEEGISATIEDNGRGFDTRNKNNFEGIGLKNIQTRINYLKGTVEWDSATGKGTVVAIYVPV